MPKAKLKITNLKTFEEDEKRNNVNLGRTNKIKNDIKDATARQAKENVVAARQDCSNLQEGLNSGKNAYLLLLNEFEAVGGMQTRIIRKGSNAGKTSQNQKWSKCTPTTTYIIHWMTSHIVFLSLHL